MAWFIYGLQHYGDFDGRASRREYWSNYTASMLIGAVLFALSIFAHPVMILAVLFQVGTFLPTVAVTVRRLHDTGLSGKWAALYVLSAGLLWVSLFLGSKALFALTSQALNGSDVDLLNLASGTGLPNFSGIESIAEVGEVLSMIIFILVCRRGSAAKNCYGRVPAA
jgi:uncharacterized membrane protein YhaH (DUF805 family)